MTATSTPATPDASAGSAPTDPTPHRGRRPDPAILILAAAVLVATASWIIVPLVRLSAGAPAAPPAAGQTSTVPAAPPVALPGAVGPIADPGGVGATLDDRLPVDQRIAFWADRVQARPDDFLSIAQLAVVDAEKARLTVDLSLYDTSLQLVERSLSLYPKYPPTIGIRASLRFAIHDFSGARADAQAVLAKSPSDPGALGVLGDAQLELGHPAEAAAAFDKLQAVSPGPWVDVRLARLAYATGHPGDAVTLSRHAVVTAPSDDPADTWFYDYAAGEFARLTGDAATAKGSYEAALAIRPNDLGSLVGLARVNASAGDVTDAMSGLRHAADIAPQPETIALLGDLQALGGDPGDAAKQYATVRLTGQLSALAGSVYDRQLDLFELDHGGASDAILADAQAALAVRSDPAGHDTVAWALYRLGRFDEASEESTAARAGGIVDARILYHAGAIAIARGDRTSGGNLLRQALALGPGLDPLERHVAESLLAG